MSEDLKESCEIRFEEVYRRLDAVEKYNTEKQDEKINSIDKMVVKFEMLFAQQNETNKTMNETNKIILERFEEDRKENIKVGKERDAIIKELSQNVMKTTEELVKINTQQEKLSKEIEIISERGKLDLPMIAKNIIITGLTGSTVAFIVFLIRFFIKST